MISFRGTCAPKDLITDATITQDAWVEGEDVNRQDIAKAHAGFRYVSLLLRPHPGLTQSYPLLTLSSMKKLPEFYIKATEGINFGDSIARRRHITVRYARHRA